MIYSRINKIIDSEKLIENRIRLLQSNGFEVKRCYVPTYNKVGGITSVSYTHLTLPTNSLV